MKYEEIKNLQVMELRKRINQTRQTLFESKIKHKMKRLSNALEIRKLRKDIACLQMVLLQASQKLENKPIARPKKEVVNKTTVIKKNVPVHDSTPKKTPVLKTAQRVKKQTSDKKAHISIRSTNVSAGSIKNKGLAKKVSNKKTKQDAVTKETQSTTSKKQNWFGLGRFFSKEKSSSSKDNS